MTDRTIIKIIKCVTEGSLIDNCDDCKYSKACHAIVRQIEPIRLRFNDNGSDRE